MRAEGTWYQPVDGVVVRAPLLPVQRYLAIGDPAADPLMRLAVCVASDSLSGELARRGRTPDRDARRSAAAVLRYLIRCATRPTPYGLFAGVAVGAWGEATDVRIAEGPRRVRARPDMAWLTGFVLDVEELLRPLLSLVANTCAFELDGRVHLSDRAAGGGFGGPDVSVRATGAVRRALAAARRPRPYQDLVSELLASLPGATVEQVRGLIDELCRLDLLITDLRPPLTGRPVEHVLGTLNATPGAGRLADQLGEVVTLAADIDTAGTATAEAAEAAVAAVVRFRTRLRTVAAETGGRARIVRSTQGAQVVQRPTRAASDVLQVDTALTLAGGSVAHRVAADAARAVDLLLRLHPAPGGPRHLGAYRAAFLHRYGPDRRVPLLQLLDPRFGLGLPDPAQGHRGHHAPADAGDRRAGARRAERLWELATRPTAAEGGEVVLTGDDVRALALWTPEPARLPPSVELSVFVLAASGAAVDRGDYLMMVGPNLGAHEAGRGLGRFADLLGAPATGLLRQVVDRERHLRAGVLAAELAYLPRNHRSANVTVRESLRELEIPVGVTPGVTPDRVVAPDELSVGVRAGRLRLWWEPAGHEIAVTAGHMLNHGGAPDVCRFLHEIGTDGLTTPAAFDWGPANALPVLPRVRHGRIVLRPARWRHDREHAAQALRVGDPEAFRQALPRWRQRWRLPRRVYLAAGDNRLLLDLDDRDQAELLRLHLRGGRGELVLQEALPAPEHAWVTGPGGHYVSELVVPLVRRTPDRPPPATPAGELAAAATRGSRERAEQVRMRRPGSDWLYVTLSGPAAEQDTIVAGPLLTLAEDLRTRGQVRSWFFVRYAEPEHQLRLRLRGEPPVLRGAVLPELMAAAGDLIAAGRLRRAGIETYERELERYGGPDTIELAEAVFAADSLAVAGLLGTAASRLGRLPLAALNVDDLLAGLGLDAAQRLSWYTEHAPPPRESAAAHRLHGPRVEELLHATGSDDDEVTAVLARRAADLGPLSRQLAARHAAGTCQLPLATLARSFVHMSCNRLGIDQGSERIVLGLLRRNAHSRLRRAGRSGLELVQSGLDRPVGGG